MNLQLATIFVILAVELAEAGIVELTDDFCAYLPPYCFSLHSESVSRSEADSSCILKGGNIGIVNEDNINLLTKLLNSKGVSKAWVGPESVKVLESRGVQSEENSYNVRRGRVTHSYICQNLEKACSTADVQILHAEFEYCQANVTISRGTKLYVTCDQGYKLVGESSIQCHEGKWSTYPQCVATCSPPKIPQRAQLIQPKSAYTAEETAILICLEGYFALSNHPTTHLTITCKNVNVWEPDVLPCLPAEHFTHNYNPHQLEVIEAAEGENVTLPCKINATEDIDNTQVRWLWLKNQEDVSTIKDDSISVDITGTLILFQVNIKLTAVYSCFLHVRDQFIPGKVSYNVKLQTDCVQFKNVSLLVVEEYTSTLLFCPDLASHLVNLPVWYKDGNRIWHDKGITLLPNGGLFIQKVMYSDRGLYTCTLPKESILCERNITTQLDVVPSSESLCGMAKSSTEYPWLVTLWWQEEKVPFCYGSLVNEGWVVTTSSCLFGLHRKRTPDIYVKFGWDRSLKDIDGPQDAGNVMPVQYVKVHPNYSRRLGTSDIGLVKLKNPVNFTEDIRPICFAGDDIGPLYTARLPCEKPVNLTGYVPGWGSLEGDDLVPSVEPMVWFPQDNLPKSMKQTYPEGIFCAKGQLAKPLYSGDTGSPFQVPWKGRVFLYGVFSWGERKFKTGEFDYFTKVTGHVRWLNSYINRK